MLTSGHDYVHQLIHREMHDPTPALDAIVDQAIRPRIDYLSGVVARMTGADPSDDAVLRSVASIQSQSVSYMPNPIAARLGYTFPPTPASVDEAAEHIARFSIAGVYAVARPRAGAATRPRRRSG